MSIAVCLLASRMYVSVSKATPWLLMAVDASSSVGIHIGHTLNCIASALQIMFSGKKDVRDIVSNHSDDLTG